MTFAWQTFASLRLFTSLFTLARIPCILHICVKNKPFLSRFQIISKAGNFSSKFVTKKFMSALIYPLKSKVFNFDPLKMCYRTKKSRRGLLLLHHNYKNFLVNQNELERNFEPLKQTKKIK